MSEYQSFQRLQHNLRERERKNSAVTVFEPINYVLSEFAVDRAIIRRFKDINYQYELNMIFKIKYLKNGSSKRSHSTW